MDNAYKPKVAVYKFSSCDGCQLSLLNLEDELLDLASAVDIAYFLEATRAVKPGPYDVGIVEGLFALIDGMIIAGGKTQQEVERVLRHLLPPEKIKLVYVFHLKVK